MTYRKQRSEKSKVLWDYLFFNPRASSSFDTWMLVFESRRLCRQVDREMKAMMTPAQYKAYLAAGEPEHKSWWERLFGGKR
jgi:hypothetical protein